jgi:hypothetical protein
VGRGKFRARYVALGVDDGVLDLHAQFNNLGLVGPFDDAAAVPRAGKIWVETDVKRVVALKPRLPSEKLGPAAPGSVKASLHGVCACSDEIALVHRVEPNQLDPKIGYPIPVGIAHNVRAVVDRSRVIPNFPYQLAPLAPEKPPRSAVTKWKSWFPEAVLASIVRRSIRSSRSSKS